MAHSSKVANTTSSHKVNSRRRWLKPETLEGYFFAGPAILGFLIFVMVPVLASLYFSFTEYNIIRPAVWVGLQNYITAFTGDRLFWVAVRVTLIYTLISVPLNLAIGFLIAILMNQKVKWVSLHRTIWYMPVIVPAVANAVLWQWVFNPDFGLLNLMLNMVGITGPRWLVEPNTAIPAFVIMGLWSVGGGMLIYLGGLQGIPEHLYEAVDIDGGNWWDRFWNVTVPMMTPVIFFNLIIGLINTFQVFTPAYVMTQGGPAYATHFYVLHLYKKAFQSLDMGYASAMAWLLMIMIILLTWTLFRTSTWVYYEGGDAK